MANRPYDPRSRGRDAYRGADENYDEGDSSARAGSYDHGRSRVGGANTEQGNASGRYAGYGNFGEGDYSGSGRGSNTGENRYGMPGYAGGRDPGQGRRDAGQSERGEQNYARSGSRGDDNQRRGDDGYGYGSAGRERGWGESQGPRAGGGAQYGDDRGGSGQGLHRGKGPKGYQRSDERLQEMISERLREDPHIDASEVTVTCQNGTITLEGTVDSRHTKNAIEDVAEQLGVEDVQNNLRVQRPQSTRPVSGESDLSKQRH